MKPSFMHPDQLAALDAIADAGTFEAAARRLGVSTSAVSQRIRALESATGRVLVQRGTPSVVTGDGAVVLRYARQQALLAAEMASELELGREPAGESAPGVGTPPVRLTVAVNADSLAGWFGRVIERAVAWETGLELTVADETRTAELLRSGQVMCAVSSSRTRIAGCSVTRLGVLRYAPVAAPSLLEAAGPHADPASLPSVRFDADDDLQDLALREAGLPRPGARASIPMPSAFQGALEAGLGWGMMPEGAGAPRTGLVPVPGLGSVERTLYWHRWSIRSSSLDRLSDAVQKSFAR